MLSSMNNAASMASLRRFFSQQMAAASEYPCRRMANYVWKYSSSRDVANVSGLSSLIAMR